MSESQQNTPGPMPTFFKWFPWEKTSIWILFLLLVYALRSFFTVMFLTFIFTYITTNVVGRVIRFVSPGKYRPIFYRILVILTFLLLIGSLYGLVSFLKNPLREQINRLLIKFQTLKPQTLFMDLMRDTVGAWQFDKYYRNSGGEEKKKEDFKKFREEQFNTTALKEFQEFQKRLQTQFETTLKYTEGHARLEQLEKTDRLLPILSEWVSQNKAPQIYQAGSTTWDKTWAEFYIQLNGKTKDQKFSEEPPYEVLEQNLQEFEKRRSRWILNKIATAQVEEMKDAPPADFVNYLGELAYRELSASGKIQELFKEYYNSRKKDPNDPNYTHEDFVALTQALQISQTRFHQTLGKFLGGMDPAQQEKEIQLKFERGKKQELADVVVREWEFIEIDKINREIGSWIPKFTIVLGHWGIYLFQFTIWFAMSLMLSFFIAFDLPRLRRGIQRLESSRFRDFYQEIAPSLATFGVIIGRAFQAQGVIAICNTFLTLLLIKFLNMSFEIFLCTIVFFCSFVPILGVIFSTVPIAILAYQDHGIMTSLYSILGIIGIHFIETSILNPKILGDMLKLHPVLILGVLVVGEHFFGAWGLLLGVPVMVYVIRYVILGESLTTTLHSK